MVRHHAGSPITSMFHITKFWSTHIPVLMRVVEISDGPVLELGAGVFSTPVLHWMCMVRQRRLITLEESELYFQWARQFRSNNHSIRHVADLEDFPYKDFFWSVVLVDHGDDKRRGRDAIRLKNNADYIVLHDTNPSCQSTFGYDEVWQEFKYRYDWYACSPYTSVVSNFRELDNIYGPNGRFEGTG